MSKDDIMRLAIETGASLPTIEKWAGGQPINVPIGYALRQACKKLGIAAPKPGVPRTEPAKRGGK